MLNIFDFSVMDSQYRGSFSKQFYYLNHPSIEGGLEAWAHSLINGKISVLKGSCFRKRAVDSCPRNARSKRDEIRREENILIEFNDSFMFNRDYSFDTKNEAGQVISGNSSSNSQNWEEITDEQRWQALNRTRQTRIGEINKARKKQKIKELTSKYESRLKNISTEEKKQLGTIRIGQDVLRDYLLDTRRKCPLTDIKNRNLLRVSHIKPWAQFEDIRLDPDNCLLLSPFWDVAFDRGLITFSQTGILQLSEGIIRELDRIGSYNNRINFENILDKDNHLDYLEWHREKWHRDRERVFPD